MLEMNLPTEATNPVRKIFRFDLLAKYFNCSILGNMNENDRDRGEMEPVSSVCLLDGSYFFWEAVVFDADLSMLLESYRDGELLETVEDFLDAVKNEEIDESDPNERDIWTIEIPEALQMAMRSRISQLIIDYEKQLSFVPVKDRLN